MFVSVTLITEKLEDVIVIPSDAITTYLGEPVVYIAEGGTAKRVAVTISVSDDNLSVITSGLSGGEQLITAGSVVEGSRIAVIKEEV
jgi:multidrug efflux pump subunit AcrA (membrane-fusion protein)